MACARAQRGWGLNVTKSIFGELCARQITFGFSNVLRPPEIAPVEFVGAEGEDRFSLGGEAEISGNDGKRAFLGQVGEDAR